MHNETFFLLTFTTIFLIPFSILIFNYSEDFDWGELTYEDKITIEREIVNENGCIRLIYDIYDSTLYYFIIID